MARDTAKRAQLRSARADLRATKAAAQAQERAAQVEAHRRDPLAMRRDRQLRIYGAVVLGIVVVLLVVVALVRKPTHAARTVGTLAQRSAIAAELRGIPQTGTTLGNPAAAVTIQVVANPLCAPCAEFDHTSFAELLRHDVRPGVARLQIEPWAAGTVPQERVAARAVLTAAAQGRVWQFLELLYANQGTDVNDTVGSAHLDLIARGAGLDAARFEHDRLTDSDALDRSVDTVVRGADGHDIDAIPAFVIRGPHRTVTLSSSDTDASDVEEAVRQVR